MSQNIAICNIDQFNDNVDRLNIGLMNQECPHCRALRFHSEKKSICCHNGKSHGQHISHLSPHSSLLPLFSGISSQSRSFIKKIRKYNQAFSFTSMRSNLDANLANESDGVYTFRVNGELYHRIGNFEAQNGNDPQFCQIYFMDPDIQSERRLQIFSDLDAATTQVLHQSLQSHNLLVQQFVSARESAANTPNIILKINGTTVPVGQHPRRYNSSSVSEVAAVLLDDNNVTNRDIVLRRREGGLLRINETHPAYDALSYPLFFPQGRHGWSIEMKQQHKITLKSYVQYLIQCRNEANVLHMGGKLFQQYVVDQFLRIEQQNLMFIRNNQQQLRAECYQGIVDALGGNNSSHIGRRIIVPATTIGSTRYMQQRFQDSMALVRKFGKPDLFLTMTCNPKWPEITQLLEPHQKAQDRFDIVTRVFHVKLHKMMKDIVSNKIFGATKAHCYTIEFQKRGLPHAHILLWLEVKPSEATFDDYVCAEIPDSTTQPILFQSVKSHMMHGPCGVINQSCPCMKNGHCSHSYPKQLNEVTVALENGKIIHRRRNTGRVVLKHAQRNIVELDNKWVVPYNPYLLTKYDCHINVEICNSVSSVKYLHKYIYKGHDRARIMKKPCSLNFSKSILTFNNQYKMVMPNKISSHIVSFQNIMHGIKGQKLG